MKIKYTNFCPDPQLRNTETHLPNHVAQVLIATGQAKEVKLPPRGAPGWAEARIAESKELNHGPSNGDTVVPFVHPPRWELGVMPITKKTGIYFRAGTETNCFSSLTWFDNAGKECPIPALAHCPKEIIEKFKEVLANEALAATGELATALEAQQAQQDYNNKTATTRFFNRLGIDVSGR